jgi:hypothetical protein
MKSFLEWWLDNRTDEDGWFHCACSWESGQDGSKRFRLGDVAATAEDVRTVDIEAAMANGLRNMILFAEVAGETQDVEYWKELAGKRVERTRAMFVDGRFRDFDARTGEPIILDEYYSVMMLAPISLNIASKEQMQASTEIFEYFRDNYRFWLEWPSFLFPFTEAGWYAEQRKMLGDILVTSGNGVFEGLDQQNPLYVKPSKNAPGLSPKYNYRIPGVAHEWWPYKREKDKFAVGCENYGWGATFPTLLIRNIIGFRENLDKVDSNEFHIAPALSPILFKEGKSYGISNLSYRGTKTDLNYTIKPNGKLEVALNCKSDKEIKLIVKDEKGKVMASSKSFGKTQNIKFKGLNYELYNVEIVSR